MASPNTTFAEVLTAFATTSASKLDPGLGEPEDQIRAPFEVLLKEAGRILLNVSFETIGETHLSEDHIRPDYSILVEKHPLPLGFVELKAPGFGADTSKFKGHNKVQWEALAKLPNVLYSDGNDWALYRQGVCLHDVRLKGNIEKGSLAENDGALQALLVDFLSWEPTAPKNSAQLVAAIAGLTRLLRDEVLELLNTGGTMDALASDWRDLLFPEASAEEFADGYAQAVTFALLLARAEGIDLSGGSIPMIAGQLGKQHSLMGKALSVLTDAGVIGQLDMSVKTLLRVIGVVDWSKIKNRGKEPWLRFYEDFLEDYDQDLRKKTGSYYTPADVVGSMVRLTDDLLKTRLGITEGFASKSVTVLDPAMGTGTFLLQVIRRVVADVTETQGAAAAPAVVNELAERLIGFEKQLGPYAVSEFRTFAEYHEQNAEVPATGLRLFVTDTLADPYVEVGKLPAMMEPIARSRRAANKIKSEEPVMVVIGNPPYKDQSKGKGGWVEDGGAEKGDPSILESFREPDNGSLEYVLSNLYVFFWRWALWKTFESDESNDRGVVTFITPSAWLSGPGFKGMRRWLREQADEIFVIDCSPEGHQPDVSTRIFPGVAQPLAITIVVRKGLTFKTSPAKVWRTAVTGKSPEKLKELTKISLASDEWQECSSAWTSRFVPAGGDVWEGLPLLSDLLPWTSPGVKPNRTFVYGVTQEVLEERWNTFIESPVGERGLLMKETPDRSLTRSVPPLPGFPASTGTLANENGSMPKLARVAFRPLDTVWLLPDARLLDRARPDLWAARGPSQLFFSEQHSEPITSGPALVIASDVPDMHHFNNRGGRAIPLWRDSGASEPNLAPGLLNMLGNKVKAEDLFAYIAAVVASPAYTNRFVDALESPGVRIPLTTDTDLFWRTVEVGRECIWLWTDGARMSDETARSGKPRLSPEQRPMVKVAIPHTDDAMPDDIDYDEDSETLLIGMGRVGPVPKTTWNYETSDYKVVQRWLKRRLRSPLGKKTTPLDSIVVHAWTSEMTTELLELLNLVGRLVQLESAQSKLLDEIMESRLTTSAVLTESGVLPVPKWATQCKKPDSGKLFDG